MSATTTRAISDRIRQGIALLAVSTAVLTGSSGVGWSAVGNAAPGGSAQKSYPEVDITGLSLRPLPAGTPQTSATVADPDAATPRWDVDRALDASYVEQEFLVQGVASTYTGPTTGPVEVATTNVPYVTRVLVRYPKDPAAFSGRVLVEPFNTSTGGKDRDVLWSRTAPLLQSNGDAWVGITERTSATAALKKADPTRYADLDVSTNDLAWDILAQIGAVIRAGGAQSPLAGLDPEHVYMGGYSQSGVETAGFALAFAKRSGTPEGAPVYDGYFPAAHSASVTPVKAGTGLLPTFETPVMRPVGVPVVDLESQSDVEGFSAPLPEAVQAQLGMTDYTSVSGASVRRPDSDRPDDQYRLYEVAGMPHQSGAPDCEGTPSTFPNAALLRGALNLLYRWVEDGDRPPKGPRIEMATLDTVSKAKVDQYGNAVGGVRSPYLDLALARYDARSPGPVTCNLSGREVALDRSILVEQYKNVNKYMKQFTKQLDAMIRDGYLLRADRTQLLADQRDKATQALGQ